MAAHRPIGGVRAAVTLGAVALLSALGSCIPQRASVPTAPPVRPTARPVLVAPVPTDWQDAPVTPGDWHWQREGGRSVASFGLPQQPPLLTLACDPARSAIILARRGAIGPAGALTIATTSLSRRLAITTTDGTAAITLPARDPLLDAMAFSRGRFAVSVTGLEPLYVPSWPEVSRVIEDCR